MTGVVGKENKNANIQRHKKNTQATTDKVPERNNNKKG